MGQLHSMAANTRGFIFSNSLLLLLHWLSEIVEKSSFELDGEKSPQNFPAWERSVELAADSGPSDPD